VQEFYSRLQFVRKSLRDVKHYKRRKRGCRDLLAQCQKYQQAFGGLQAVADVSLDVTSGKNLARDRPERAGKTTLFT